MTDDIKLLEQKNKSLSDQLDKVTADLFKMQDAATEFKNKLDERKHTEQLAGWAIDRAIETAKIMKDLSVVSGTHSIIDMAKEYCDGVRDIADHIPPKETIQ